MKNYKFIDDPISDVYLKILKDIKNLKSKRESILNNHLYEFNNYNIHKLEDKDTKISRLTGRSFTYPNTFLASSLGFNRSSWNKKYEEILKKFGLKKKLKYQTFRNMKEFEKLKYLIIKYYETIKK